MNRECYGTSGGDGSINITHDGADPDPDPHADPDTDGDVVEEELPPRPLWHLSLGRASADAPCPAGYSPSWDYWPNNGTGGYVCNRVVFGDEPLR